VYELGLGDFAGVVVAHPLQNTLNFAVRQVFAIFPQESA
jgi:hypothetical protein